MKTFIAILESVNPYSQGRHHGTPKLEKENHDDYEKRTWREKMHVTKDGYVFIPPMSFKKCVVEAAAYLSIKIPGKGKQTYTKHFRQGIMVTDGPVLNYKKEDVEGIWHFVPSDGKAGGGKRVLKCFPTMPEWKAEVVYYILDHTITLDVFREHLDAAGKFVGIGVFRPARDGYFGRFKIVDVQEA